MRTHTLYRLSCAIAFGLLAIACGSDDETTSNLADASTLDSQSSSDSQTSQEASLPDTGTAADSNTTSDAEQGEAAPACTDTVAACDPLGRDSNAACADSAHGCYAKSDGTTFCACLKDQQGPQNAPCSVAADCQTGFVCVRDTCRTICTPNATTATCEGGGAIPCKALGSSTKYGYCES